jgi:hypothetical protein
VERFDDPDLPLEAYLEVVLVACPACAACARVARHDDTRTDLFADRRLTCLGCGHVRETTQRHYATGGPIDPWFGVPLWLQADVKGEVLWAYNAEHLAWLWDFVAATHRRDDATRNHMRSVANRLPKWIGLAKHRQPILAAIAELEATLPT